MVEESKRLGTWSRDQLEDNYLRAYNENIQLKKLSREQEEKMKKMATKILRMANDKKLLDGANVGETTTEEYKQKLITQQKKIADLTNKVQWLQNQMSASNLKTGTPAPARVPQTNMSNSRRSRENINTVINDNISHQNYIQTQETIRDFQRQRASLEQLLRQTAEQNNFNEQKIFDLQKKLGEQESVFQEQLQQSKLELATKQRIALQENLELIRIQRELQEKKNSLSMLETQQNQTCTRLQATEAANRELVSTVNRLQQDLQAKDMELASLKAALVSSNSYKLKVTTLENQLADFKRENEILSKQTETITASSITNVSAQPTSSAPQPAEIQMLREKLRQAQSTVELLARERRERNGRSSSLQAALARAQAAEAEVATLHAQARNTKSLPQTASLQTLCEVVGVDMTDLETALMMLREQKLSKESDLGSRLGLLKLDDPDESSDLQQRIRRAELEHAETIQELEKTRQLLTVQYRINKEYRAEAASATNRLTDLKAECEQQLQEYARLLDIRAARIHQLETQLNNIAYGTRYYKVSKPTTEEADEAGDDSMLEFEEQLALERGDNLLELHLGVLRLTDEAIDVLTKVDTAGEGGISPEELRLFCTWDFFDFETQATALVQGASADFNLTVQYPVQMDEFFLNYLHKGRCVVELYQSNNTTFRLLAACCLNLAQLLSGWEDNSTLKSPGIDQRSGRAVARRHAQADFIGVTDSATASKAQLPGISGLSGLLVARLDYYLRLRVPMEQSIRLYLNKAKVLPLLATFAEPGVPSFKKALAERGRSEESSPETRSGMFKGVNQLVISIVKASGLRSNQTDRLPSAYFVYQFYNLSEYMSTVQQATSAPVFDDVHTMSLRITPELDLYLRTSNLQVYLLDDAETDVAAACLGVASIPLIGLARQDSDGAAEGTSSSSGDGRVRGLFELQRPNEQKTTSDGIAEKQGSLGTIEVNLYWLFPYDVRPASAAAETSTGSKLSIPSLKKAAVIKATAADTQATVQSSVDTKEPTTPSSSLLPSTNKARTPEKLVKEDVLENEVVRGTQKVISAPVNSSSRKSSHASSAKNQPNDVKVSPTAPSSSRLLSATKSRPADNLATEDVLEDEVVQGTHETISAQPTSSSLKSSRASSAKSKTDDIEVSTEGPTTPLSLRFPSATKSRPTDKLVKDDVLEDEVVQGTQEATAAQPTGSSRKSSRASSAQSKSDDAEISRSKSDTLSKADTGVTREPSPSGHKETGSGFLHPIAKEGRETIKPKIASKRRVSSLAAINRSPRLATVPERQVASASGQRMLAMPSTESLPPELEKKEKKTVLKPPMTTVSETEVAKVDNANATDPDDTEPISLAVSEELIDLPSPEQSLSTELTLRSTILSPKERPFKSRRSSKIVGGATSAAPKPRPRSSSSINSLPDRTPTQSPDTLTGAKMSSGDTSLEPTPRLPREKKDSSEGMSRQPINNTKEDIVSRDTVKICVHQLLLKPSAAPINDSHQVYVEYSFLGLPNPVASASKPVAFSGKGTNSFRRVDFEFSQVFPVDSVNNYARRRHLAEMLTKDGPTVGGVITFRFVTKPKENATSGVSGTTKVAKEYAEAKVDLRRVLKDQRDLLKEAIPVVSVGAEKETIGEVTVTIHCLAALTAISDEFPVDAHLAVNL